MRRALQTGALLSLAAESGFLVAGVALLFAGRLPAIVYPIRLNPDEVQMGAITLRILRHGAGWGSLDGTTVGPLLAGGRVVASRQASLSAYPDWTEFEFDGTGRVDALRVTVVSFRGKGGGLNEIKILRR